MNAHMFRNKFVLGLSGLVLLVGAGVVIGVAITSGGGTANAANNPGAAVPAGEGARLSASLSPASKAAFADDKITNTEYVDATNAYIKCVRDARLRRHRTNVVRRSSDVHRRAVCE